jgi:hypothetical protein
LLPQCLLDITEGQFHQCVTNQQARYNLPINNGVRYAKIILIKWVRWVICKTTDSRTQFHTGRRFTPHKHDHNGQDKKKKEEDMKLHQKKQDDCVQKYKGDVHIHQI